MLFSWLRLCPVDNAAESVSSCLCSRTNRENTISRITPSGMILRVLDGWPGISVGVHCSRLEGGPRPRNAAGRPSPTTELPADAHLVQASQRFQIRKPYLAEETQLLPENLWDTRFLMRWGCYIFEATVEVERLPACLLAWKPRVLSLSWGLANTAPALHGSKIEVSAGDSRPGSHNI